MSSGGQVHVVGAGLAGLAAAVALARSGHRVALYESAPDAGGRCRSYFDSELGVRLDNGNHLLLSGNRSATAYLDQIGARDTLEPPGKAVIPFADLATGERWALRPNRGVVPWWVYRTGRRVPGSRSSDYYRAVLALHYAGENDTITDRLDPTSPLFRRLWQPVAVAALNTRAELGSALLFWQVLRETLGRGANACRPLIPRQGLSESLVDPALAMLRRNGADIHFAARLRGIRFDGERVGELNFDDELVEVAPLDQVVLAVPAAVAARLVAELTVPDEHEPIVNAHYRIEPPADMPAFTGLVGGTAEWAFRKPGVISVTVSAADPIVDLPAEQLSEALWCDVAAAFGLPAAPLPPARIIKERRATFRASPAQLKRRPATQTRWNNLVLAGDYVDTGLPATIEGAIRSGLAAAAAISGWPGARLDHRHSHLESAQRTNDGGTGADNPSHAHSRLARYGGRAGGRLAAVAPT
jgi:squalene-associated FAD-dependent desaturase